MCFIIGVCWYVALTIQQDLSHQGTTFTDHFKLEELDESSILIVLTYFVFSTITTVGLGDFYPISNFERIMSSIIFLISIMVVTRVVTYLISIFQRIQAIVGPIEFEQQELDQFFRLLQKLNGNRPVRKAI
mmetsp:Transcript_2692/g.4212  ORF Transcript_2692/g.4212 Transcript_2692/m.4212 type:complete len:131 (-) Transcript_2692:87-479(-)